MGSVMGALGEGYHVDEGRRCWKRCEHGCKRGWNGVQLSVLIRVDHFAVEGEGRKKLRLPESSIAVLGACAEHGSSPRAPGAPLRLIIIIISLSIPPTSLHFHPPPIAISDRSLQYALRVN